MGVPINLGYQQNEFFIQLIDLIFKIYRRMRISMKKNLEDIAFKEFVKILVVMCSDFIIVAVEKYINTFCRIQDFKFACIDFATLIKFCQIIPFCLSPFIIIAFSCKFKVGTFPYE